MRKKVSMLVAAVLSVGVFAVAGLAQSETISAAVGDRYVISAKPGGVNLVEGTVSVYRESGRTGVLVKGDKIAEAETVVTGADGRAEILLNPGSYVRLAPNTRFVFDSAELDDLKLNVIEGSAIFEIFTDDEFEVKVVSNDASFLIRRSGVYRVDAINGKSTLEVWKGRAEVEGDDATVKAGREAVVASGGEVTVAKFDRDNRDEFETWSRARAKELAKMTSSLKDRDLSRALTSSYRGNLWNLNDTFGIWVFNPFYGSYCFLPFGRGWRSPYGYWYGYDIWAYRLPWIYNTPRTGNSGGGNGGGNTPQTQERERRPSIPPFERMGGRPSAPASTQTPDIFVPQRTRIPSGTPPLGGGSSNPSKKPENR